MTQPIPRPRHISVRIEFYDASVTLLEAVSEFPGDIESPELEDEFHPTPEMLRANPKAPHTHIDRLYRLTLRSKKWIVKNG